jgi:hypothetical protein
MAKFYGKAMKPNGKIFGRLGAVKASVKGASDDGNFFGAISYMGGFILGGKFGSPRHMQELEKRTEDIERHNLELTTKLENLKEHHASSVANQIDQEPQDARVDGLLARLSLLEVQDRDGIWIGTYTFTNVVDCEAFLSAKVPVKVVSAYCYDMVSLVHCLPKNGDAVSPEVILQRDYMAHKVGFTHVGSAFIYSSKQHALPGSLAGHHLPGVKVFKEWDNEDGVTGKQADITWSMDTTVQALLSIFIRKFWGHPEAMAVFEMMILQGRIHWQAYADFLSNTQNVCFKQCEDKQEAWLYPCKVGKGVFEEALKVQMVGGERSSTK